MKTMSTLAAIPIAVLFLTWLSLQSLNTSAELFDRTLGEMDRFTMLEATLHRDVLNVRTGMLRNYDPLDWELNGLTASLTRLREAAPVNAEAAALIERLAASLARQEDFVEQFKTDNALLQNSLAYFGFLTNRIGGFNAAGEFALATSALAAAVLRLTLNTSPTTVHDVQNLLDNLAAQISSRNKDDLTRALLAHGRLLTELLPAIDHVLNALAVEPARQEVEDLRAVVVTRQAASRTMARRYRLTLYLTSLILIGLLAQLGLLLRKRALALQRRAALEHVIARISMYLLTAQAHEIDARIVQALHDLATSVEADRAYFLCSSAGPQTWSWGGTEFPPGWPECAPALAERLHPATGSLIYVPSANSLPPGEVRDMFTAFGLRRWVYISSTQNDGGFAALGFDVVGRSGRVSASGELGLIPIALDTIFNAIGREQLERKRARLEARVQQAQRLETVGALASGIAHNFNNMLGAIMGYTEMAEAGTVSGSPLAVNLGEIRLAGERARILINQLLTFGRRRDPWRHPVNMGELMSESTSLLRASLPPGVAVNVHDFPANVVVAGEHAQLQQIILNLCNNAAQAMDDVGRIDIEANVLKLASARSLSHGELASGQYICVAVSDIGRGMSGPTLERIFEPFFTTRDTGNGFGLATVWEIVREHGGAMNVLSSLGVGSRFEAWLPCTIAGCLAGSELLQAPIGGMGQTVLLIDDDQEQLLRAEELLAALGYEPVGFTDPVDALRACRNEPSRFDVILISQRPRAAWPFELAVRLREVLPALPLLLATPSAVELAPDALLAAGISNVVHWPIIASEIAIALERDLGDGGLQTHARSLL